MSDSLKHLDFSKLKTYSIKDRTSKVDIKDFSVPWKKGESFSAFLDTLPSILAGNDLRYVINAICLAAKNDRPVCFAMGGHVIKTGMSPIIIDMMKKKVLTMLSMNGSGIIHDLERIYCFAIIISEGRSYNMERVYSILKISIPIVFGIIIVSTKIYAG